MARTIKEIQDSLDAAKAADPVLSTQLTSTSKVAIWRLWNYIVAFCQNALEVLYDLHKAEVAVKIANEKPHTLKWYQLMALAFQYGDTLAVESDFYDPIDETHRIVTKCAAVEANPFVRIKVAKTAGGELAALSTPELNALRAYMQRVKDAGVRIQVTSNDPDDIQHSLYVYYDPLVLTVTGERIDGTNDFPVLTAYKTFLKDVLPFNGLFVINQLLDKIRAVEGVVNVYSGLCQTKYAALPYSDVMAEYVPDSGYLKLDEVHFLANIGYEAHSPIA